MNKLVFIIPLLAIFLVGGVYAIVLNENLDNASSTKDIGAEWGDVKLNAPLISSFQKFVENNPQATAILLKTISSKSADSNSISLINTVERISSINGFYPDSVKDNVIIFNDASVYSKNSIDDLKQYASDNNKRVLINHDEGSDLIYPNDDDMINDINYMAGYELATHENIKVPNEDPSAYVVKSNAYYADKENNLGFCIPIEG